MSIHSFLAMMKIFMISRLKENLFVVLITSAFWFVLGVFAEKFLLDVAENADPSNTLKLVIVVCLVFIILLFVILLIRFSDLENKILRTKVNYYGIEKAFKESQKIIENAEDYIWIVNSWMDDNHLLKSEEAQTAQREYFEQLIKKVEKGIEYKRIIQLHIKTDKLPNLKGDSIFKEHLLEMNKMKEKHPSKINLSKTLAQRLTTFVLVDGKHLIWQINEVTQKDNKKHLEPQGAFIFRNDVGEITNHFKALFKELENSNNKSSISNEEINNGIYKTL